MRILVCLLLAGCATPMNELYRQLNECLHSGHVCADVQDEIQRREIAQDQREYDSRSRCQSGYIEYCDHRMRGCGGVHKSPRDQYLCVTPGEIKGIWK